TLTNGAPTSGLPSYVTIRADNPSGAPVPGSNLLWVSLYTTTGSQLLGATLDGSPIDLAVDEERGHPIYSADITLNPQATATLVLHLREPTSRGPALVLRQPLVEPETVQSSVPAC
ncbi:MAG: DUF4012 domain-containing protein, partial [Mycobacteriales bacterium]